MSARAAIALSLLLLSEASAASEPARTVTQAPNARYAAGPAHRLLFGGHWREAWTTPLEVPVLDLGTFDGGLQPRREGGGNQTHSLRFRSGNGRIWAFRSVDKDARRTLDADTAASVIGDLAQDQTSAAYPVGALVVAPLLEAAGVHHATPHLFVLPDDERLGAFRKFAGMMGLLEERIEHRLGKDHAVVDTVTLLQRLERRSDERVDARVYLRARLVDLLVADWDRHFAQYHWVRIDEGGEHAWQPIPRDRDLAFTRYDGLVPATTEYYFKGVTSYAARFGEVEKLSYSGRFTDRRFLVGLERPEWEAVADDLAARLTDAVLADAVRRLPAELYARDGAELERSLRARRDALPGAARELYRILAREVDLHGTTEGEDVAIERKASGAVEVAIYARDAATGARAGAPLLHRTFVPDETSEIRLYTLGGADRIAVRGETGRTIAVRVVAPGGKAEVDDRSSPRSALTLHAPLPDGPVGKGDVNRLGPERAVAVAHYQPFRDWGSDTLVYPQLSYDAARGLVLGAYVQRTAYGFQLDPLSSVTSLGAAYSMRTNRPRLELGADVRTRSPVRGLLYLAWSGMDQAKFYGFGDDTPRDARRASAGFYDVTQDHLVADAMLDAAIAGPLHGRLGVQFKRAFSVERSGILELDRPSGADGRNLLSPEVGLKLDTHTGTFTARRGISLEVIGRHTPSVLGNPDAFSKVRGQLSAAVGGHLLTDVSLGLRVAGEKNWGRYPFFEAAFLGGSPRRAGPLDVTGASTGNLLRGYDLNRFAGDAAFVTNGELSVGLGKVTSVVPLRYGLVALADVGRVFLVGDGASKWHTGYGGGLWLGTRASSIEFDFATAVKATVVRSAEGTSFYLASAFGF